MCVWVGWGFLEGGEGKAKTCINSCFFARKFYSLNLTNQGRQNLLWAKKNEKSEVYPVSSSHCKKLYKSRDQCMTLKICCESEHVEDLGGSVIYSHLLPISPPSHREWPGLENVLNDGWKWGVGGGQCVRHETDDRSSTAAKTPARNPRPEPGLVKWKLLKWVRFVSIQNQLKEGILWVVFWRTLYHPSSSGSPTPCSLPTWRAE